MKFKSLFTNKNRTATFKNITEIPRNFKRKLLAYYEVENFRQMVKKLYMNYKTLNDKRKEVKKTLKETYKEIGQLEKELKKLKQQNNETISTLSDFSQKSKRDCDEVLVNIPFLPNLEILNENGNLANLIRPYKVFGIIVSQTGFNDESVEVGDVAVLPVNLDPMKDTEIEIAQKIDHVVDILLEKVPDDWNICLVGGEVAFDYTDKDLALPRIRNGKVIIEYSLKTLSKCKKERKRK